MVKAGVIGSGKFGTNYIRILGEVGNLAAIFSRTRGTLEKAVSAANLKDAPKLTTDYRDILNDDEIEAIVIATPGSTHYEIAKKSLLSGKHTLVEKPIAFSQKEMLELNGIAEKKEKILMAGHLHLFNPGIIKLREDIKRGVLGKIRYLNFIHTGKGPVREDMSCFWDFFPHSVSIMLYLLDDLPIDSVASGCSHINRVKEDAAIISLKFPGEIMSSSFCSWIHHEKKMEFCVSGDKKTAVFNDYAAEKLKYFDAEDTSSGFSVKLDSAMPLTAELDYFFDCIKKGKITKNGPEDALKVTSVLEQAYCKMHRTLKK